jgi:phosphatidylserine/phosphatidylglycerophosphate/cardiolipin synthase-like enzyme
MYKMKFLLAAIICSLSILFAQTPIAEIRGNNSSGVPVNMDQQFTVSGIVTSTTQLGFNGPASIQDETAGLSIYGSGFAGQVQIGDSVTITSTLTHFNGLTQFGYSSSGSSFINHGNVGEPEPEVVTVSEILNQDWNGVELYESKLIRINNVTINASGTFSVNTNYSYSDGTGTSEIRIDTDVSDIVGTNIPSSSIDIIGVLSQYDPSPPHSSGYQLMPRRLVDIVTGNQPLIIGSVIASNITPSSFKVYFNTAREGDSKVQYGTTTDLELGTVEIDESTTNHIVEITELQPLTKYYFKAMSENESGVSESDILSVYTASDNPETGTINAYFNFSVDTTVALPGNAAKGDADFPSVVINRINSAVYSIDLALYSFFGISQIPDAIIAAKNRGVKVRLVYDNRTVQSSIQELLNAGIKMSQRPPIDGIMHNKFAIIDARDEDPNNDWVITGSWNWTSLELDWRNNVIEINDPSLASAYTVEFEEMWGSNTDNPSVSNAKFGPYKSDNTTHSFNIGGREVKLYFSPSDNTESQISSALATADSSMYFSLLVFTSDPLYTTILNRNINGITDIRGIINDINVNGSEFSYLVNLDGAEVFAFSGSGKLHHKYALVDASYYSSDPILITGSHNWSRSANEDNDENTLIIHDVYLANQYMQEFKKRYNELGGTTEFVIPIITSIEDKNNLYPNDIELYQNYPNPFNPLTTFSFFVPQTQYVDLSVYNLLGEKVASIFNGEAQAGKHIYDFRADNLSSGIYFYTLTTGQNSITKKLMLLK